MDLQRIREITAYNANARTACKDALRTWLNGHMQEFQFAVTLTLKQSYKVKNNNGVYMRKLKREDCEGIAKRFTQKLNKQAYGHAAKRDGKGLRYFATVEGVGNGKRLHLHLAVGGFEQKPMLFKEMVKNAIALVDGMDEQHDVQVMDSGWMEYMTKELNAHSTDNVLWNVA
ncbi:MAG: hypothetical protein E6Q78_11520 [Rhodoferax sp.]|nr:MAG: hypothetical protein E6Q78_11520 [Rhodoferax sp.]